MNKKYIDAFSILLLIVVNQTLPCAMDSLGQNNIVENIVAAQAVSFDDDQFSNGIFPTLIGLEVPYDHRGFLSFSIFQGFQVLDITYNDTEKKTSNSFRFHIAYHGSYDFRTPDSSGPIVSRLQNPLIYGEYRYTNQNYTLPIYFGWAHESNGMYLNSTGQADTFALLNLKYDPQDFASMGWNYWWIKSGITHFFGGTVGTGSSEEHQNKIGVMIEFRYHVEQHSLFQRSDLEDNAFFYHPAPAYGIKSYDGTSLSLTYQYVSENLSKYLFSIEVKTGEIFYRKRFVHNSLIITFMPTLRCGSMTLPLYITQEWSFKHQLSNYDQRITTTNIGIALSTERLFNSIFNINQDLN